MATSQTVLLVEDDKDDQEFFTSAIEEIKDVILLSIAKNGKEAIHSLQTSKIRPSMIFMDINMPVMDGIECLRHIVNDPATNEIPVVMLSSESYYNEKLRSLGAAGFIKKQLSISALRDELEQMISKFSRIYEERKIAQSSRTNEK